MSRTYRRTNTYHPWWWSDEIEFNAYYDVGTDKCWATRTWKKELARYHSDATDFCTPDRLFRRMYGHKRDRADARLRLRIELHALEKGNVIFNKTRNIDWDWY